MIIFNCISKGAYTVDFLNKGVIYRKETEPKFEAECLFLL